MSWDRRNVDWDTKKARTLYDQGLSYPEIARALGVTKNQISSYSARHWPNRAIDAERQAKHFKPASAKPPPIKRVPRGASTLPPLGSQP